MIRELRFGSGRVALARDRTVYVFAAPNTYWVYSKPEAGVLLYTFSSVTKLKQHVRFI